MYDSQRVHGIEKETNNITIIIVIMIIIIYYTYKAIVVLFFICPIQIRIKFVISCDIVHYKYNFIVKQSSLKQSVTLFEH